MNRIYVRFPNWVGDVVMALPFLQALHERCPRAHIAVALRRRLAALLLGNPFLSEMISISRKDEHGFFSLARWSSRLRKAGFDAAIVLPPSFSSALPPFLARIPQRTGWNTDIRSLLLTRPIARDKPFSKRPLVRQYMDLLGGASGQAADQIPFPQICVTSQHRELASAVKKRYGIVDLPRPLIALNPSASFGPAKRWIPSRFGELANRLKRKTHGSVLLVGGPNERPGLEQVKGFTDNAVDGVFVGSADQGIAELVGILAEADLLISNDTGAAHVAAALGKPVLTVFGCTSTVWTAPQGPHAKTLSHPVACSPCHRPACKMPRHLCMEAVSVDEVTDAALQMLHVNKEAA